MKRFLKKLFLLAAALLVALGAVISFNYYVVGSQYGYSYQAALMDKLQRLHSIDQPKIILVGHSNLAFGIDSERLETALSMPVVNLGFHGGLSNEFHENIAKGYIGEGDLVVVCHSSFANDTSLGDGLLAWTTIDNHPEIARLFSRKDYAAMLQVYPEYLKKNLFLWASRSGNRVPEGSYARTAFNAYGDVAWKPESSQMDADALFSNKVIAVPSIDDACVARLNQYNQYITERGASLVIAGYPIAYGKYSSFGEEEFKTFGENLQNALDCDVISDYTDYFFPYEYFYDTVLHLNTEGVAARTSQLIADLNAWKVETKN